MGRTSRVGMRLLKAYVFAAASLLIVVTLTAFQNQAQQTRFGFVDLAAEFTPSPTADGVSMARFLRER